MGIVLILSNRCSKENDKGSGEAPVLTTVSVNYAVSDSRSISPEGWHVPSETELATLIGYLGSGSAGAKIRETGTSHWSSPNSGATNETKKAHESLQTQPFSSAEVVSMIFIRI